MISVAESFIKKFKRLSSREPRLPNDSLFFVMCSRVKTTEDFVKKSNKVHNNKFNYSKTIYVKSSDKVIIICPIHKEFEQKANNHLIGRGCSKCGGSRISSSKTKTTHQFIHESKIVHGDRYDYSKVHYIRSDKIVIITCKIHGDFEQKPNTHLLGSGCPECSKIKIGQLKRLTKIEFIKKSKLVHGNTYIYDLVCYKTARVKVKILCKKHGVFEQTPDSHLSGHGCFKCGFELLSKNNQENTPGWSVSNWDSAGKRSKRFDSFKVYIIKCFNDTETFYKIGRTFLKTQVRFQNYYAMPYNYEIIKEYIFDNAKDAFSKEIELKKLNKANKYVPLISFSGRYECFSKII